MTITFVRHSKPDVDPDSPPRTWPLSPVGRRRAEELGALLADRLGRRTVAVHASAEIKAVETARFLGLGPVMEDERFGEVSKPWYDEPTDHEAAVRHFLAGNDQAGWESRRSAFDRFDAAVGSLTESDPIVVTHGTVLSLWLSERADGFDPTAFWLGLDMPDAWCFDESARSLSRV